jgi:L-ribulokinase
VGSVAVGIDFGTLSGRAVVVNVDDGTEIASAVHTYSRGVMDASLPNGRPLGPGWALQAPEDWRAVVKHAVPEALQASGVALSDVVGIATDFTACTVLPVTTEGVPLCEVPGLADRPHSWPKLWKHHAAQAQADRINALAREWGEPWLARYGGAISAEWEFAKALQILDEDPDIYRATDLWVEAADWIVWELCGSLVRNPCTAGYKGIFQDGRYPSREFLAALNGEFADFAEHKLAGPMGSLGSVAGGLSARVAQWTGLPEGIPVAVGNVDAHVTAAAADAVRPGRLVAIMGTSTCHVVNGDQLVEVPGMCGVVDGGIVAGLWGYEAGQSGVGDIFGWFVENLVPSDVHSAAAAENLGIHDYLGRASDRTPVGGHGLIALDWMSGNRSVLVNHDLSGLILGLTLSTPPEDIYRALVESTAFGTRMIVETFRNAGVPIHEFVAAGGLTRNRWLMQVYADVLGMPIRCVASGQGPALGSAIHAAVAAGAYPDVTTASAAMGRLEPGAIEPDAGRHAAYSLLYSEYVSLHDWFGRGGNEVMRRLATLRREVMAGALDDF